uniref:Large ribosomal subunit protein uL13c n=1 Tax=Aureoumbra lagunensis TaxID=44058 RepID=C6KIW2_9STRA|nr:50S ribosomal protein L13 [Aureoumbra lagunensis]ACS36918.1 50S ribosomal protein L13 [Aureoumbra lagunensis]
MNSLMSVSPIDTKKWYLIDAKGKTLGRLASIIATIISGRHKSTYVPNINCGDNVVVINVELVKISGKKSTQKVYRRHSGRPGSLKTETFEELQQRIPERILEKAVKGMLPKGTLGRDMYRNLKVYKGGNHPHVAQNPEVLI